MQAMDRVHGTEMEWSIHVESDTLSGSRVANQSLIYPLVDAYLSTVPHIGHPAKCFLIDGSRFYKDVHDKWETTTPEHTSYIGTIASEIAAEQRLHAILTTPLNSRKPLPAFAFNKRVIGDSSDSWGYHESYNVPASVEISESGLAILGIHLATRNIYAGAGFLKLGGKFSISQKATDLNCDFSNDTIRRKPVVNLRNEQQSNDDTRRVHVTSGDPSMSPWAARMQLGTTSLVLALIQNGLIKEDINFVPSNDDDGLVRFGKALAKDCDTSSETFRDAIDMQRQLQKYAASLEDLTPQQQWVVDEWDRICHDLENNPKVAGNRVEWMARHYMLMRYQEKHGYPWDSVIMRQRDRQFDRIGPGSIGQALRETGWSEWMPDAELIERMKTSAPPTTRAAIRSRFIQACYDARRRGNTKGGADLDWPFIRYGTRRVELDDPYATENPEVDALIDEILAA